MSASRTEQFARLIHMPPAMVPYVNLFVNEQELGLVHTWPKFWREHDPSLE